MTDLGGTILVVDYNRDTVRLLRLLLVEQGFAVRVATDGAGALASVRTELPDLILLDVNLPDLSGYEVCARLQEDPEGAKVPVMFISGASEPLDKIKAFQVGALDYVTKPFQSEEVLARIDTHLRLSRMQHELEELVQHRTASLRKSEQLFRRIFESAAHGIVLADLDGHLVKVNRAFCEFLGRHESELVGEHVTSLAHPDDVGASTIFGQQLKAGEAPAFRYDKCYLHADGHAVWGAVSGGTVTDSDGSPLYPVGHIVDVTNERLAKEALQHSQVIVANSSDLLALLDEKYTYLAANPAYLKRFGKTSDQVVGRKLGEVAGEEFLAIVRPHIKRALRGEEVTWQGWVEFPSGKCYLDVSFQPLFDPDDGIRGFLLKGTDVTDRVEAEEQRRLLEQHLEKTEKMDTIGTLAAGIAHDFNNLLVPIIGYAGIVQRSLGADSAMHGQLGHVLEAGERASDLVDHILMFSRDVKPSKEAIRLGVVVEEAFKFLRASVPATVEMALRVDDEGPSVYADPSQLHQVVMNLGVNAARATGEAGGMIEVSVDETEVDHRFFALHPDFKGKRAARLVVRDSGVGMSPETLERLFEPFYTTRASGEGTGLGLSVLYGIVQSHGGVVTVDSELGVGTTFELLFPLWNAEPDTGPQQGQLDPAGGLERILVVDDEDAISELLQVALEELGYSVVVYTNSEVALADFLADIEGYDLVITDQMMPCLTGSGMATEMLSARPDLPIILMSGYAGVLESQPALELGFAARLKKPFRMEQLASTVREVLDNRSE